MVDFRRLDKLWKKRHDRSDLEWRVKYLRESCTSLADICRGRTDRRQTSTEPESVLKSMRDVFSSFPRSKSRNDITTDSSISVNRSASNSKRNSKKPALLESIISNACEIYNDIDAVRQNNLEQLNEIMTESRNVANDIRIGVHDARRKFDEASTSHKRAQNVLAKVRQIAESNHSYGYNAEMTARLNNASEREYEASREHEVQGDHFHCEILKRASMESDVARIFLKFIENEATVMESAARILRNQIPKLYDELENYTFQPVFGLDLDIHLRLCRREIAFVIEKCVESLSSENALKSEGLFRVTPNSLKLKKMVSELNLCAPEELSEEYEPHVIAGALKQYLRDLPRSLMIGPTLVKSWENAARMSKSEETLATIRKLVLSLPDTYLHNLRFVFGYLKKVTSFRDVNKMTASNIAICMACSLCFGEGDRRTISCAPVLVGFVIENYESIFEEFQDVKDRSHSYDHIESHHRSSKLHDRSGNRWRNSDVTQSEKLSKGRAPAPPKPKLVTHLNAYNVKNTGAISTLLKSSNLLAFSVEIGGQSASLLPSSEPKQSEVVHKDEIIKEDANAQNDKSSKCDKHRYG